MMPRTRCGFAASGGAMCATGRGFVSRFASCGRRGFVSGDAARAAHSFSASRFAARATGHSFAVSRFAARATGHSFAVSRFAARATGRGFALDDAARATAHSFSASRFAARATGCGFSASRFSACAAGRGFSASRFSACATRAVLTALAAPAVWLFAAPAPAQEENPPPPPAPVVEKKPEAPVGGGQRERFEKALERLREIGGEGDFSGFADQAREEARQRREAALERGVAMKSFGRDPLEEEMFFEEIAEAGLWGSSGCFENEEELPVHRDFFFHGALTRRHFRGELAEEAGAGETAPRSADLFVTLTCDLHIEVVEEGAEGFVVGAARADHIALASYRRSWWRRNPGRSHEAVLRHQQLHFDLAKLIADDLDERFRRGRVVIVGEGRSRAVALGSFQERWTEHIQRAREELRRLRMRYDTETRNGADLEKQAQWEALVRAGIDALRATGGK